MLRPHYGARTACRARRYDVGSRRARLHATCKSMCRPATEWSPPTPQSMATSLEYQQALPRTADLQAWSFSPGEFVGPDDTRRILNVMVAAVGLVLSLPLMFLIAALIKLTS